MCYLRSYGLLRPSCISHPFPLLPFPQSPILDRLIFPMSRPAWWQWPCSPPPSPLFCLQPQQQQPLYGGAGAAAPPTSSSASSSAQQYGYGGYPGGAGSGAGAPPGGPPPPRQQQSFGQGQGALGGPPSNGARMGGPPPMPGSTDANAPGHGQSLGWQSAQQKQPLGPGPGAGPGGAPTSGRGAQFFSVGGDGAAAQPTPMQVRGSRRRERVVRGPSAVGGASVIHMCILFRAKSILFRKSQHRVPNCRILTRCSHFLCILFWRSEGWDAWVPLSNVMRCLEKEEEGQGLSLC